MSDVTRAVIITQPRSGSEFLVEALNSHPDIFSHSEIMKRFDPHELMWAMKSFYDGDASRYDKEHEVRCHKLFYYHLTPYSWHEIKRQARTGSLKIIHLIRSNHSHRVASWFFKDNARTLPTEVKQWWFDYKVRMSHDSVNLFRADLASIPHVELVLEDMMGDDKKLERIPVKENKKLCSFLGVRYRVLSGTPKEPTNYLTSKYISNLDEVLGKKAVHRGGKKK